MRNDSLHLVRMLGRTVNEHPAIFLWQGHRDVAFEIELILSTQRHAPLQAMGRIFEGHVRLAANQCFAR
jgi:hypothetical protein